MKNIVIIGAGGFAREVLWLIDDINKTENQWNVVGFIDDNLELKGRELNGTTVIGNFNDINLPEYDKLYYVCAIGEPRIKKILVNKAESIGLSAATLIHPSVIKSKFIDIGEGSIICAGSILTVNIRIGKHVIINLDCTIGHDVEVRDYVTILPSVNVSGNVLLDECSNIGTGTAIIQGKMIGENSIIGAGSVVVKDIEENCTAVGVPAKVIKR